MKVCIFGAGSVGVHYARAWSKLGASISVFDIDSEALHRFEHQIWPQRYGGAMHPSISLNMLESLENSALSFDLTIVGTPPPSHAQLTEMAIDLHLSNFVSVQKPVGTPSKAILEDFLRIEVLAESKGITLLSGYNHRYSQAFRALLRILSTPRWSEADSFSIVVTWREAWDGILRAHPWLNGPSDSYLGHTLSGGGSLFEHSHGLDLGLFIWRRLTNLPPTEFHADIRWSPDSNYDEDSSVSLISEDLTLTVSQDVLSLPAEKSIEVRTSSQSVLVEFSSAEDSIRESGPGQSTEKFFPKSRETDFDSEASVLCTIIGGLKERAASLEMTDFSQALGVSILGAAAIHRARGDFALSDELLQTWIARQP
ncbi:Gfo/Idh/MocA family oxidoreductase [Aquiluna sp.]|nr:Gfo/Idh/MocA family oxidoreductase [Aquiluna sp.]